LILLANASFLIVLTLFSKSIRKNIFHSYPTFKSTHPISRVKYLRLQFTPFIDKCTDLRRIRLEGERPEDEIGPTSP